MENENVTNVRIEQPNKGIGYGIAGAAALTVIIDLVSQLDYSYGGTVGASWSNLFRLGYVVYYLIWVGKLHKTVAAQTNDEYPISSQKAVWFHIIPFFNLYWIFNWPIQMIKYIEQNKGAGSITTGKFIGFMIGGVVISIIPIPADGALLFIGSLAMMFVNLYFLHSFFDDVATIESDEMSETSSNQTATTSSSNAVNMDNLSGWLLLGMPGIFVLQTLLSYIQILPFGFMRIFDIFLSLAFWGIPLFIGIKMENPKLKLFLIIGSGLALLIVILSVFLRPYFGMYY